MKKQFVVVSFTASMLSLLFLSDVPYAESKKKWNNPEAHERYRIYQREAAEAYHDETKAWENYDRELKRAQDDVRRVRDKAVKGAIIGTLAGPGGAAAGAAVGAAKGATQGATQGLYQRGKEYYENRKK